MLVWELLFSAGLLLQAVVNNFTRSEVKRLVAESRQERVNLTDLKQSLDTLTLAVKDLAQMRDDLRHEESIRRFQQESAQLSKGGWRGV